MFFKGFSVNSVSSVYKKGIKKQSLSEMTGMVEFYAMLTQRTFIREEWANLILGTSLLFGLILRLFPGLMAGFPLNDGGMFLIMIRELRADSFALPAFTGYNYAAIPFAYPPFGLYIAALLSASGVSEMDVLRWLPVAVNFLSIPAFFLLAAALLNDRPRAALATAFFALTASSYSWQIMGGGVTRSFGMAFFILAMWSVYQMFQSREWRLVLRSILLCALAVLSHPEVSLATAANCALLWIFFGRTRSGTVQAALVGLGTLLATSVWWGSVLAQHGLGPFLSVIHSGAYIDSPLQGIFSALFSPASLFTLPGLLRMAGIVWFIKQKHFFLLAWLVMPFFVEPRSALAIAFLPSCLLFAVGLMDALPSVVDWIKTKRGQAVSSLDATQRRWLSLTVLGIVFYLFLQSALYDFRLINTSLVPPHPQAAFDWVRRNTPRASQFFILTGRPGIMSDPMQEWFPALAERRSQTTLQGLEWTLGPAFFPRLEDLVALQACKRVLCVEAWSAATGLGYSHVVIQISQSSEVLHAAFLAEDAYQLVYENPEVEIFEKLSATVGTGTLRHLRSARRLSVPTVTLSY